MDQSLRRFTGVLENMDVKRMANIGHFNIDKNKVLREKVINEIHSAALWAPPVHGTRRLRRTEQWPDLDLEHARFT